MPKLDPKWKDPKVRAEAIATWAPFKNWPEPALRRLAQAATVSTHPARTELVGYARPMQQLVFVLQGATQASITEPSGRRVTFLYDASTLVYGLAPLLDGGELMHEQITIDAVTSMSLPFDALRAELDAAPRLWQSLAVEMCSRYRRVSAQMTRFVFNAPRVHMAALLLGLIDKDHRAAVKGEPVVIGMRLSQERLAEMLAISRQWTTQIIQETVKDGLLQWRYRRVTVLDLERLRAMAGASASAP
jgi:CRP-like cAMP-binding protein